MKRSISATLLLLVIAVTNHLYAQKLVINATPGIIYGKADFDPSPNNKGVTYTSSNPLVATIVANKVHVVGVGSTIITGTIGGNHGSGTIQVVPAPLTITANNQSRFYSFANPPLTVTYTGFVNGDTQASLTTQPIVSTTASTASAAGNYPITVSGAVAANYTISYSPGTLTIKSLTNVPYGTPDFNPDPAVTGITYSVDNSAVATVVNNKIHLVGAGVVTITGTKSGHQGSQPIQVTPAKLTITANNLTKVYGTANPTFTLSYAGFVSGDTYLTGLTKQATVTTTAKTASIPGTYTISVSGATSTKYSITYISGNLTVNPPPPPAIKYTASTQTFTVAKAITAFSPVNTGGAIPLTNYGEVSTYAGVNTHETESAYGHVDGPLLTARFFNPSGIAIDASSNLYIGDTYNNVVRKISSDGIVSTLAGTSALGYKDTIASAAIFERPVGVAVDASGNVFVSDYDNNVIRKISASGIVTTLAGSKAQGDVDATGTAARFYNPSAMAIDASGNLFVSDIVNYKIRKVTQGGVVTTVAGGSISLFFAPDGVAVDPSGNIYVADYDHHQIKKITKDGVLTVLTGSSTTSGNTDGSLSQALFYNPSGVTIDALGNLYVADYSNQNIRKITPSGIVSTLAGSLTKFVGNLDGIGTSAYFYNPYSIVSDPSGNLFVTDTHYALIRKISVTGYSISPALPAGLSFDGTTGAISGMPSAPSAAANYTITAYNIGGSSSTVINIGITATGTPAPVITYSSPQSFTVGKTISPLTPVNTGGAIPSAVYANVTTLAGAGVVGFTNGPAATSKFNLPAGVAADSLGNIFVADMSNNVIRKITAAGVVSTFAGSGTAGSANGTGILASFQSPSDVAADKAGNVYVADYANNLIRKITTAGIVTTLAGSGTAGSTNGTGTAASFNQPAGLCVDGNNNIYVADKSNNMIRKITPAGVVTTLAGNTTAGYLNGTGTTASFTTPVDVVADKTGNIYVSDNGNSIIRKITPAGVVCNYAGKGLGFSTDGTSINAIFAYIQQLAIDAAGNIYVSQANDLIREISTALMVTTVSGTGSAGSINAVGKLASFNNPVGLAIGTSNNLLIADQKNYKIRSIGLTGYAVNAAFPAGLTLTDTTGIIKGTPTTVSTAADYTVTGYNKYGSSSYAVNIAVAAATASISLPIENAVTDNSFTIYPNPSTTSASVRYKLPAQSTVTINIYNKGGKLLRTYQSGTLPTGINENVIETSNLKMGVYIITVQAKNYTKTGELMIQ